MLVAEGTRFLNFHSQMHIPHILSNKTIKEVKPLFDCFVKVRKIGFPFSHSARRPFWYILGENGADIFEVTDVERRPRSNFLDHFHYF